MKRTYKSLTQTLVLALSVVLVACQKAPTEARIGSNGNRNNGLNAGATSTPSGITLAGIVTTDAQYQDDFQQEVYDFLEGSINPDYVGTVSATGANQTGVYVGGLVRLASGAPYTGTLAGTQSIATNSEILVSVYDKFADVQNLAPIPPIYLKQASGYVNGNQVSMKFWDAYGSITLEGTIQGNVTVLKFSFSTDRTWDGNVGHSGQLGDLRIPTCQFFRCQ